MKKKTKIFSGILAFSVYGLGSFLLIWGMAKGIQSLRYNHYLAGSDFKLCKNQSLMFNGGLEKMIDLASGLTVDMIKQNKPLFKNSHSILKNHLAGKFLDAYRIAHNSGFKNVKFNEQMINELVDLTKASASGGLGPCYGAAQSKYFTKAIKIEISKFDLIEMWDDFMFKYHNYKNPLRD